MSGNQVGFGLLFYLFPNRMKSVLALQTLSNEMYIAGDDTQ